MRTSSRQKKPPIPFDNSNNLLKSIPARPRPKKSLPTIVKAPVIPRRCPPDDSHYLVAQHATEKGIFTAHMLSLTNQSILIGDDFTSVQEAKSKCAESEEDVVGQRLVCRKCKVEFHVPLNSQPSFAEFGCPECVQWTTSIKVPEEFLPVKRYKARCDSKTGVLGVNPSRIAGKYSAKIYVNKVEKNLGESFNSIRDAERAYNKVEADYRGPVHTCKICQEKWNCFQELTRALFDACGCPKCVTWEVEKDAEKDKAKEAEKRRKAEEEEQKLNRVYYNEEYHRMPVQRRVQSIGPSGFKGVIQNRSKYQTHIYDGKKKYYLGTFLTAEKAAEAFLEAETRLFGNTFICRCGREWQVKRKVPPFVQEKRSKFQWKCPHCDPKLYVNSYDPNNPETPKPSENIKSIVGEIYLKSEAQVKGAGAKKLEGRKLLKKPKNSVSIEEKKRKAEQDAEIKKQFERDRKRKKKNGQLPPKYKQREYTELFTSSPSTNKPDNGAGLADLLVGMSGGVRPVVGGGGPMPLPPATITTTGPIPLPINPSSLPPPLNDKETASPGMNMNDAAQPSFGKDTLSTSAFMQPMMQTYGSMKNTAPTPQDAPWNVNSNGINNILAYSSSLPSNPFGKK